MLGTLVNLAADVERLTTGSKIACVVVLLHVTGRGCEQGSTRSRAV